MSLPARKQSGKKSRTADCLPEAWAFASGLICLAHVFHRLCKEARLRLSCFPQREYRRIRSMPFSPFSFRMGLPNKTGNTKLHTVPGKPAAAQITSVNTPQIHHFRPGRCVATSCRIKSLRHVGVPQPPHTSPNRHIGTRLKPPRNTCRLQKRLYLFGGVKFVGIRQQREKSMQKTAVTILWKP